MPSVDALMLRRWPVPMAGSATPPGPCTSTTRRPARWRLSVRVASSSISAHAASEMGASSRCRLFMMRVSFERTDAERTVAQRNCGIRRRDGGCVGRFHFGRRRILFDVVEERCGRNEEQIAGRSTAEIEDAVIVARRAADEHVLQHLLGNPWRAAVADEIGAKLAARRTAERHVVAQYLHLFAIFHDRGQRVMG